MKKHNTVKVVLLTLLVFVVLTWIIPAAYYSGEYVDQGRIQIGLFDLFNYPMTTLSYFGYISLFVMVVGGFYGILHIIPAYRSFLDKIVGICKGKEKIALSVIVVLLAIITSICGTQFELLLFFPMLASVILLMGFDKLVVALTLVGSTVVGIAGTTFGYNNAGLLNSVLAVELTDNILIKVIILLVGIVLLIFNILTYVSRSNVASKAALKAEKKVIKTESEKEEVKPVAKKAAETKKSPAKTSKNKKPTNKKGSTTKTKSSSKASRKDNKAAAKGDEVIVVKESLLNDSLEEFVPVVVNSKHKIWPIVIAFVLMFIIAIMGIIPWTNAFNVEAFTKASSAVSEFELFGFPIFGKLLGTFNAFGEWGITDFFLMMVVFTLLLTIIYKVKLNDVFDGFVKGVKKALAPAFLIMIVYTILVINTYHPFQLTIYNVILGITDGFNIVTTSLVSILSGLFNVDVAYSMQAVVPYFASVVTDTEVYAIAAMLFQSMYALSMLVAPTSAMLVVVLSYMGISFKEWFKAIWKLFVEFLVVLLIIFIILVLV